MKLVRHHKNPLLKEFCPNIYYSFRNRDIYFMQSDEHAKYHRMLRKNPKLNHLRALADEIATNWIFGEEALADELDKLWNQKLL